MIINDVKISICTIVYEVQCDRYKNLNDLGDGCFVGSLIQNLSDNMQLKEYDADTGTIEVKVIEKYDSAKTQTINCVAVCESLSMIVDKVVKEYKSPEK